MASTLEALMRRGINDDLAISLINKKYTLSKLKMLDEDQLLKLNMPQNFIDTILGEGRPPIPTQNLQNVLHKSRWRCCVCREENKAIIVHHIHQWSESKDHGEKNLVVLCLEHHDKAHSTSTLSQNLKPSDLKRQKKEWEATVKALDAKSLVQAASSHSDTWYYFNHLRLCELFEVNNIKIPVPANLVEQGLLDDKNFPVLKLTNKMYAYAFWEGRWLYDYMKDYLHAFISKIDVFNISDFLDISFIKNNIEPGQIIYVQGAHYFKRPKCKEWLIGPGQVSKGFRRANGVTIEYAFDAWEALSSSCYSEWISGHKSVGSLCQVKEIQQVEGGKIRVLSTVLAIGYFHNELSERSYASPQYSQQSFHYDEDYQREQFHLAEGDFNDFIDSFKRKTELYWSGELEACDICQRPFSDARFMIDAHLKTDGAACLCVTCYDEYGVGIGIGKGQVYELIDEKWYLIAGGYSDD